MGSELGSGAAVLLLLAFAFGRWHLWFRGKVWDLGGPQLCARATCAILDHAPIGSYRSRFHPDADFTCPCDGSTLETRQHVIVRCPRFHSEPRWRRREMPWLLLDLVQFLEGNPVAFSFASRLDLG